MDLVAHVPAMLLAEAEGHHELRVHLAQVLLDVPVEDLVEVLLLHAVEGLRQALLRPEGLALGVQPLGVPGPHELLRRRLLGREDATGELGPVAGAIHVGVLVLLLTFPRAEDQAFVNPVLGVAPVPHVLLDDEVPAPPEVHRQRVGVHHEDVLPLHPGQQLYKHARLRPLEAEVRIQRLLLQEEAEAVPLAICAPDGDRQ
mmetsp:Transcript_58058/g.152881  ORF Transcript_58058/g.152881 Transcript_58058/m.152881 type:complete len:201 (-) Transcript_58058:233-835(-)